MGIEIRVVVGVGAGLLQGLQVVGGKALRRGGEQGPLIGADTRSRKGLPRKLGGLDPVGIVAVSSLVAKEQQKSVLQGGHSIAVQPGIRAAKDICPADAR